MNVARAYDRDPGSITMSESNQGGLAFIEHRGGDIIAVSDELREKFDSAMKQILPFRVEYLEHDARPHRRCHYYRRLRNGPESSDA